MFGLNPYQKRIAEAGLVFEVSQDQTEIAFMKQSPFALLEQMEDGKWGYWTNDCLMLDGIKFQYRQWHSIEGNSVLKSYLTQLFGYNTKGEKE